MNAINEEKVAQRREEVSKLLHTSWGLMRYPNYFLRQQLEDIEAAERLLSEKLELLRLQKQHVIKISHLQNRYNEQHPIHPAIVYCSQCFSPTIMQLLDLPPSFPIDAFVSSSLSKKQIMALCESIEEESGNIFRLDAFLSAEMCGNLISRLQHFENYIESVTIDGDILKLLHQRAPTLALLGLSSVESAVYHLIQSSASYLYPAEFKSASLDWRHAYIAAYNSASDSGHRRQALIPHTDDAEHNTSYTGGDLVFKKSNSDVQYSIRPSIGTLLIHRGRQLHEVLPVSGERYQMIMWCRSNKVRIYDYGLRKNTCPCCWMNERNTDDCISGDRWN